MASYENVNYSLRPAKNTERKMVIDALRRLSPFGRVSSYRYIGLGSVFFADFILVHKRLGIQHMISIEREERHRDRFEFNRPFANIRLEYGSSTDVLARLRWDVRTLMWLDYDDPLSEEILADIAFFFGNAPTGSVLVFTVNAEPGPAEDRLENLRDKFKSDRLPNALRNSDLAQDGTGRLYAKIINAQIQEALAIRNGVVPAGAEFEYRQLFHFRYRDGARMLTLGGLLIDAGQVGGFSQCGFEDLDFYRGGETPFDLDVPILTAREMAHLDKQLPIDDVEALELPSVNKRHIKAYAAVYKYAPKFTEVES